MVFDIPSNYLPIWRTLRCFLATALLVSHSSMHADPFIAESVATAASLTSWERLAPLPDREGFAGIFAGVVENSLLVAGGANFPLQKPWEGGAKVWSDTIFILDQPTDDWRIAGKLPRPLAYGASITTPDGVICIGGSDSQRHYDNVFCIARSGATLQFKPLPSLPKPCANLSAALVGQTIYVAGGIERPGSTLALKTFWALDLTRQKTGWRQLEPWPGRERMLAVAAADNSSFFLFSGAALKPGKDDQPIRDWLIDAFRFTPGRGWTKLPALPRPTVAAPSPAPVRDGKVLLFGGDDGSQVSVPPTAHRGFSRNLLMFDSQLNRWEDLGESPFALVTTTPVTWRDRLIIPGGEIRPGTRSTEIWARPLN